MSMTKNQVRWVPWRVALVLSAVLGLGACATRPVNPPITEASPAVGLRFPDAAEVPAEPGEPGHPGLLWRGHACGRLLLRRARVPAAHRGGRPQRRQDAPDRWCGHHHRRVGRQLHRAGLRPAWREAVHRLRAALPEARRARRDHRPQLQPGLLGRPAVHRLGPIGAGGAVVRRDSLRRRDLRRPEPQARPLHHGVGHRHQQRRARDLSPGHLQPVLLGPRCGDAVARCRRVVGCAGGAVAGDDQQLRRHLWQQPAAVDEALHCVGRPAAARLAGASRTARRGALQRQRKEPLHPPGRRRRVRQPGHARRARRAELPRGLAGRGVAFAAGPRAQDRRHRRQLAVVAAHGLGREGAGAWLGGGAAEVGRRADRPLFLRGGGNAEGHCGALAGDAQGA